MIRILLRIFGSLVLLAAATLLAAWFHFDEEHTLLDAGIRAQFNETFIELPNGVVHYEFGGPVDGEMVVLVHGFSVPAYIWDPTFAVVIVTVRMSLTPSVFLPTSWIS